MSSPPQGFFARLVDKLRRYAATIEDSRKELSEATEQRDDGEQRPLPPIPPDDSRSKR